MTNQFEKNSKGKHPKNFKEDILAFKENNNLESSKPVRLIEKPVNVLELEQVVEKKEIEIEEQVIEDIKTEDTLGSPKEEFEVQANNIDKERKELIKRSASERKELIKRVQNKEEVLVTDEQPLADVEVQEASESEQAITEEKKEYQEDDFNPEITWHFVDTSEGKKEIATQELKNNPDLIRINFGNRWSVVSKSDIEDLFSPENAEVENIEELVIESQEVKTEISKSPEELLDEKFASLSDGEKQFVREGIKQLQLEEVRAMAKEKYNQEINNKETGFGNRLWKKMTQGFQMAKLEKESFQEVKLNSEEHLDYTSRLMDLAKSVGKEIKNENGEIVIDFNTFEGLSKETEKSFIDFNAAANAFSSLPREWAFESAKSDEQKKYQEAKNKYEKIKTDVLNKIIKEKGEVDGWDGRIAALEGMNNIDGQIAMRQFIINNPEVQKELDNINDNSPLKRMFSSIVAERGALTGAGFAARSGVKAAGYFGAAGASVVALPLIAMSIGGIRGRSRANKKIKEEDIQGRHNEKEAKSDLENERTLALEKLQSLIPNKFSFEPQEWLDKVATEEEKKAYQEAKDNFTSLNQKFEQESGITRNKKGQVKKIEKGLEANVSHSEDLIEKLENVIGRYEQALEKNDSKNIEALEELIFSRVSFIEEKLERGLISFGSGPERSTKYLELTQALAKANVLKHYTKHAEDVEKRVGSFLDYLKGETSKSRNYYKNKKMVQGALIGGAAFAAGALLREGVGLLSGDHEVVRAAAVSASAKPKLTEASDLSVKPKVEEVHNEIKEAEPASVKSNPVKDEVKIVERPQHVSGAKIHHPEEIVNKAKPIEANNIEQLQHMSNMDKEDTWQEYGPTDEHQVNVDTGEISNQEVELPENGSVEVDYEHPVNINTDEVVNQEVELPENGSIGEIDEQLKNEFQKIPSMDGKQVSPSSVLENNIEEVKVSNQEVKLPDEGEIDIINEPSKIPTNEDINQEISERILPHNEEVSFEDSAYNGNQEVAPGTEHVIKSAEFTVEYGSKISNVVQDLYDNLKTEKYDNLKSFVEQIKKLNGGTELNKEEAIRAERIWKEWESDKFEDYHMATTKARLGLLTLEHEILERLPKIKK